MLPPEEAPFAISLFDFQFRRVMALCMLTPLSLSLYSSSSLLSPPPFVLLLRPLLRQVLRPLSLFVHAFVACEYFPGRRPIIYALMALSLFKRKYDCQSLLCLWPGDKIRKLCGRKELHGWKSPSDWGVCLDFLASVMQEAPPTGQTLV